MKILFGIPTYNENKNISIIVHKVNKLSIVKDILIVDDNSKDGSLQELKKLKLLIKNFFFIIRNKKNGIGSAHKDIIAYAYKKKYDFLCTLDADGTHDPKYFFQMLKKISNNDLIITNRFFYKDSLEEWTYLRKLITISRHHVVNFLLNLKVDTSGAFRLYNLNAINKKDILLAKHNGYSFFWESIFFLKKQNYKISQIPVLLKSRTYGSSKINFKEIVSAILYLVYVFFRYRIIFKNKI
tara:strand:- start:1534 stop:2253 length:720 start_codon:yes stop_codon:yes gene_type:complete